MLSYAVTPEVFTHWESPSTRSGEWKGKALVVPDAHDAPNNPEANVPPMNPGGYVEEVICCHCGVKAKYAPVSIGN